MAKVADKQQNITMRPSWQAVYDGYPKNADGTDDLRADKVFKLVKGENYNKIFFQNACATRVSIALLEANMELAGDYPIYIGKYSGKSFIASAYHLKQELLQVWGDADEKIPGHTTLGSVQKIINGRNGVYIILNVFSNASGHATLWVGEENNVIGGHNYIKNTNLKSIIYFWELK